MNLVQSNLAAWQSYYVVVGSAGAALIGLQFVVVTLIAGMRGRSDAGALGAFATPTVAHLTAVLVASAVMSVPWPALAPAAVVLALLSAGGLGYGASTIHQMRRQQDYRPVWEDWLWFAILPCAAYLTLTLGAVLLVAATAAALLMLGAAALALLLIGIHNAWDTVTHLVVGHRTNEKPPAREHHKGDSRR